MSHKCTNCKYEGEEVSESGHCPVCGDNLEELVKSTSEVQKKEKLSIAKRIKSITEDLLDDGKLNHSNDPTKKSPGRKKRGKR